MESTVNQSKSSVDSVSQLLQPAFTNQLTYEVRVPVLSFKVPHPVVVVAQGWPCWLPSLLSLHIPVAQAFFPSRLHDVFSSGNSNWGTAHEFEAAHYTKAVLLGSGSMKFWASHFLPALARLSAGCAMFCLETPFAQARHRSIDRLWRKMVGEAGQHGCFATVWRHSDFGGATSGNHLIISWGLAPESDFVPPPSTPRVLRHVVESATRGSFAPIAKPMESGEALSRAPIITDGMLQVDGLYDVSQPSLLVACPSVFAKTGWVKRSLSRKEFLRLFDLPTSMDKVLMERRDLNDFVNVTSPLVVTSVFRTLWGVVMGDEVSKRMEAVPPPHNASDAMGLENIEDAGIVVERDTGGQGDQNLNSRSDEEEEEHTCNWSGVQDELLDLIKQARDIAKAVKADDAEVPVHLWNERVCRGRVSEQEAKALDVIRGLCMRSYRRRLVRDCGRWMRHKHGVEWYKLATIAAKEERGRLAEIVWRAAFNEWFEYPNGSRLVYFRFPSRYQALARDGVAPFFLKDQTPTPFSSRMKPTPAEDERAILSKKIATIIHKRYIVPPSEKLRSCIQFFAVPKGMVDGVAQDWRVVYHAGANKLNDCVWAPSFWLPSVSSLLRMLDSDSLMEDRDIGEMFLNFELHPSLHKFAGVDVGHLSLDGDVTEGRRWYCWTKNLMGFRPSPYNSVKMYLIAEEVIRGDRHDANNAFQWDRICLNLPGTADYVPSKPWLCKVRRDGSVASDFVSFMDDQRISAAGERRINEAGHTLSTRESYLGIQDALRKWRAAGGTRRPGAWAGTVVFNDEVLGIAVLTSQEKWDRLKTICAKWTACLEAGAMEGNYKEMQSDRGFLVYVSQAYPAMKPYLKGFHLSLEMWRGDRDSEGWKLKMASAKWEEEVTELMPEDLLLHAGPPSGVTPFVPRLKDDLLALSALTISEKPILRVVRSKTVHTAFYGFGDASSSGFGASVARKDGTQGRFGLWARDEDKESSNFRELLNLVQTVEGEVKCGAMKNAELWIFTDNSTAESCFVKGSSKSKLLHALVVRLRQAEMKSGGTLFMVHVAGTRMMEQGTDGLSRGVLNEGVMRGDSMLSFVDIAKTAVERSPAVLDFVRSWTDKSIIPLTTEEWFREGHGIIGGRRDSHGIWIPTHAKAGRMYLWSPPPVVADAALEECLRAVHKRSDATHVFVIPRLCTPSWSRLFFKLCDFHFRVPAGSPFWPSGMHEPLWIGISLPFIRHRPWSLRGTPLLVGLARDMQEVFSSGEGDGRDILRKLLRVQGRVNSLSERLARGVLRMPGSGEVSDDEAC